MSKANQVQELQQKISKLHSMIETSGPFQWEACGVHGVETCEICGLEEEYWSGGQNSHDRRVYRLHGEELSLAEAAARACGVYSVKRVKPPINDPQQDTLSDIACSLDRIANALELFINAAIRRPPTGPDHPTSVPYVFIRTDGIN